MKQYKSFTDIDQATDFILEKYNAGDCYLNGEINGVSFTIRMNKDHGMNENNNGYFDNILSLVNGDCETMWQENGAGLLIVQKRVADADDVEQQVYHFLKDIKDFTEE